MNIQQLSLFVENKPGQLALPTRILGDAGINIVTLSLADTEQFGILRMIVKDWEQAKTILETAGCVVNITEVVAVAAPYRPGGLADVLDGLERAGINVEYMYAFPGQYDGQAVLIFRFEDTAAAMGVLKQQNIRVFETREILG
ncbi:MAG: amino acid-binding protein [Phycisphaeraceae bacterium]|nr:amino acid-binding protein [Phycisphaeraceae bacterium]